MKHSNQKLTPLRAIRQYCVKICEERLKDVRECGDESCMFHAYRLGHGARRRKAGDPAMTERRRQIVAAARFARQAKRNPMFGQGPGDQPILF